MKLWSILAAVVLLPTTSMAQAQPDMATQAIANQIGSCMIANANLSAQLQQAKQEIEALKKQIADAKPKDK